MSDADICHQPDGTRATFAIKKFDNFSDDECGDGESVWQKEVRALKELHDLNHPNLIQRLAAITRGRDHYLMFLWAQGGNLRDFWEQNNTPDLTPPLIRDIIKQLRGMAEALQKLHTYRGEHHFRHGDSKPENILVFPAETKQESEHSKFPTWAQHNITL